MVESERWESNRVGFKRMWAACLKVLVTVKDFTWTTCSVKEIGCLSSGSVCFDGCLVQRGTDKSHGGRQAGTRLNLASPLSFVHSGQLKCRLLCSFDRRSSFTYTHHIMLDEELILSGNFTVGESSNLIVFTHLATILMVCSVHFESRMNASAWHETAYVR